MKTIILFTVILSNLFFCSVDGFAQKKSESIKALKTVETFYRFHFSHENVFNKKQVSLRRGFFTPKLYRLFEAEIIRERNYLKIYPDNKPFFEVLPFQPIEFCKNDYRVESAKVKHLTATVKVNFIYSKSSCASNDGTAISYQILLSKIGENWLINNFIYDDKSDLVTDFGKAQKIQ